jgi:hypothetical protein
MFDDLTFAMRYRCPYTLHFNNGRMSYRVELSSGMPIAVVDWLKSLNMWEEFFEPIIGPICDSQLRSVAAAAHHRRCPVSTISISRLSQREHDSRSRQTSTGSSAP